MISVAITTFNRADIVGRAIRSALAFIHTMEGQVILVDDGSRDDTETKIAKDFSEDIRSGRLTFIRHTQNAGVTAAKNTAFASSPSTWVLFLDSDDELIPGSAPDVAQVLKAHASEALVLFRCVDEAGQLVGHHFTEPQRLSLERYAAHTSYGEALVAINKAVSSEPPFDSDLYGYEGIGCARLIKRFGPALLSVVISRAYHQNRTDRLSGLAGTLKRAKNLARGHMRYISICGPAMRPATRLAFRIKALAYFSAALAWMLWSRNGRRH
jgi:glycosyltransferase involved in cell wall biosynthesis